MPKIEGLNNTEKVYMVRLISFPNNLIVEEIIITELSASDIYDFYRKQPLIKITIDDIKLLSTKYIGVYKLLK